MSEETEWAIEDIRKGIHTLNENLSMIAYQLYLSNWTGSSNVTFKNFLGDLKNIQKEVKNES